MSSRDLPNDSDDLVVYWEVVEVNPDDQSVSGIYTPIEIGGLITKGDLISTIRHGLPTGLDYVTFWKADTVVGELCGSTFFFSPDMWDNVAEAAPGWLIGQLEDDASSPAAKALAELQDIAADYLSKGYASTIEKAAVLAYTKHPELYELAFR